MPKAPALARGYRRRHRALLRLQPAPPRRGLLGGIGRTPLPGTTGPGPPAAGTVVQARVLPLVAVAELIAAVRKLQVPITAKLSISCRHKIQRQTPHRPSHANHKHLVRCAVLLRRPGRTSQSCTRSAKKTSG